MAKDIYRIIKTRIHLDPKFLNLSAPEPNAQTLFIWLISGPKLNVVPSLLEGTASGLAGSIKGRVKWSESDFLRSFAEIEQQGMAIANWQSGVVFLPNGLKHNPPQSPHCFITWSRAWSLYPECELRDIALVQIMQFCEAKIKLTREGTNARAAANVWRTRLKELFNDEIKRIGPNLPDLYEKLHRLTGKPEGEFFLAEDDEATRKAHERKARERAPTRDVEKSLDALEIDFSTVGQPANAKSGSAEPRPMFSPAMRAFDDGSTSDTVLADTGITFGDYRTAVVSFNKWFGAANLGMVEEPEIVMGLLRSLAVEPDVQIGSETRCAHRAISFAIKGMMNERVRPRDQAEATAAVRMRILTQFAAPPSAQVARA